MKRVIRSSLVQGGVLSDVITSLFKAFTKYLDHLDKELNVESEIIKQSEDAVVMEVRFPADSEDQRAIRVNISPEDDKWEYVTLSYKTDDGVVQTKKHRNIKFGNFDEGTGGDEVDDAIAEAVKEFYDFDLYDGDFEAEIVE